MSDGPHRSLPMRRGWKSLAERADNNVFAADEICRALPHALENDWKAEVPQALITALKRAFLDGGQLSLLQHPSAQELEACRPLAAGFGFGQLLIDCAVESVGSGHSGDDALLNAATNALADRAARGARSVEEHYLRASSTRRAEHVRGRIDQAISGATMDVTARRLLGLGIETNARIPLKQRGLDAGVRI